MDVVVRRKGNAEIKKEEEEQDSEETEFECENAKKNAVQDKKNYK